MATQNIHSTSPPKALPHPPIPTFFLGVPKHTLAVDGGHPFRTTFQKLLNDRTPLYVNTNQCGFIFNHGFVVGTGSRNHPLCCFFALFCWRGCAQDPGLVSHRQGQGEASRSLGRRFGPGQRDPARSARGSSGSGQELVFAQRTPAVPLEKSRYLSSVAAGSKPRKNPWMDPTLRSQGFGDWVTLGPPAIGALSHPFFGGDSVALLK